MKNEALSSAAIDAAEARANAEGHRDIRRTALAHRVN